MIGRGTESAGSRVVVVAVGAKLRTPDKRMKQLGPYRKPPALPPAQGFCQTRRLRAAFGPLLVVLLVLLCPEQVLAAPAPMCGWDAQSIEAPFPIMPTRSGELKEVSCHAEFLDIVQGPWNERRPSQQVEPQKPEKVLAYLDLCLFAAVSPRLSTGTLEGEPSLPGFSSSIYRPPREPAAHLIHA